MSPVLAEAPFSAAFARRRILGYTPTLSIDTYDQL
jgi:hypothetical protein